MKTKTMFLIVFAAVLILALSGCEELPKTDEKQAAAQEVLAREADAQVGMPGITTFTEKRMVRMLYELRDKKVATFSYVMDMNGRLFHVCDSIGYGLPYGVQFMNPNRVVRDNGQSFGALTQAEPNGLFMPPTAEGTWVMCAGAKGEIDPVYIEPRVIVSAHKLKASGSWQE